MDDHGLKWSTMVDHGRRTLTIVDHGRPWLTMQDHGRPWSTMVGHGAPWSTMVEPVFGMQSLNPLTFPWGIVRPLSAHELVFKESNKAYTINQKVALGRRNSFSMAAFHPIIALDAVQKPEKPQNMLCEKCEGCDSRALPHPTHAGSMGNHITLQ